jgi:nitroreductase
MFTDQPVPGEAINGVLLVANLASSAGNMQVRDFVVVKNEETRRRLMAANHDQHHITDAPVVVCCANMDHTIQCGLRGRNLYCMQNVATLVENMLIFIAASGYGACWIGAFDEKQVADVLELPVHIRPVTIVPIGVPSKDGDKLPRVKIEGLIRYECW